MRPPTVWKVPLVITDQQKVKLPSVCEPLSVGMQYGQPCLWARVEPDAPPRDVVIRIAGTGHPLPLEPLRFIGTLITEGGSLVWHVFQELGR